MYKGIQNTPSTYAQCQVLNKKNNRKRIKKMWPINKEKSVSRNRSQMTQTMEGADQPGLSNSYCKYVQRCKVKPRNLTEKC